MTGDTLRRLIEEGEPSDAAHRHHRPTDATLRDLAAALNIAASTPVSRPHQQAAQEEAAMAGFRDAYSAATAGNRTRRRGLRDQLTRARTAMLAGVAAAVLGGGAAVAAAGGDVPFVGGDPDSAAPPSAPAPDDLEPASPDASARPAEQAQPAQAATPPATAPGTGPGTDKDTGRGPGGASTGEPGPDASTTAEADDKALRSLCTARARNPHLTPRTLVEAAGGPDRVRGYCEALLATPAQDAGPGGRPGADGSGPSAPGTAPDTGGEGDDDKGTDRP